MFGIVAHFQFDPEAFLQRRDDRGDQPVAAPRNALRPAAHLDRAGKDAGAVGRAAFLVIDELEMLGPHLHVVGAPEHVPDIGRVQLAPQLVGHALDLAREIGLHLLGQLQPLVLFQHPSEPALAALRIDADHRLVIAAEVGRVDRQVGHAPAFVVLPPVRLEPFLDRVLVAAGKGGEDQFAAIGVALVDRDLVAVFDRLDHPVDVGEVEPRIDPLGIEVERDGDEAAVARPLPIAEQAAFDPVGPGHQAQFGGRDPGAAVVVRVQADHRAFAVGQVAAEILDLVGVDIGRRRLDRGRQVQDDRPFGRGGEHVHHRLADLDREIELGGGEGFGRILEMPVGARAAAGLVAHDFRPGDRDLAHFLAAHAEDDVAPGGADRVVEMDDRRARAVEAGEAGADQVLAALREDLHGHIVGNTAGMDQRLDEIELGRARAGEADFDLLHPDFDQQVEETVLLHRVHRVDDRLVAVAQVGREPARRGGDRAAGPLPVGQGHLGEGGVFARRIAEHGHFG